MARIDKRQARTARSRIYQWQCYANLITIRSPRQWLANVFNCDKRCSVAFAIVPVHSRCLVHSDLGREPTFGFIPTHAVKLFDFANFITAAGEANQVASVQLAASAPHSVRYVDVET